MFPIQKIYDPEKNEVIYTFVGEFHEDHIPQFNQFYKNYNIVNLLIDDPIEKKPFKIKKERTCRFCKLKHPDTTFKKKAHLIPELLGNKTIFSDEECDLCNERFSYYENDLANFIGLGRTFATRKGKKGIPTYKTHDDSLRIQEDSSAGNKKILIQFAEADQPILNVNEAKKTVSIQAYRHPYIPFNVYKAILKIALAALPPDDIGDYNKAIEYLFHNPLQQKSPFFQLLIHVCPGIPFPSPMAIICEKNDLSSPIPTHTFILHFENYIYQIFLPLNQKDMWMYDGKTDVTFLKAPPLMSKQFINRFGHPNSHWINVSSQELKRREAQIMEFSYDSIKRSEKNE